MSEEEKKRRNRRSVFIGLLLFSFALLFYAITIFRMGGNVAERTL